MGGGNASRAPFALPVRGRGKVDQRRGGVIGSPRKSAFRRSVSNPSMPFCLAGAGLREAVFVTAGLAADDGEGFDPVGLAPVGRGAAGPVVERPAVPPRGKDGDGIDPVSCGSLGTDARTTCGGGGAGRWASRSALTKPIARTLKPKTLPTTRKRKIRTRYAFYKYSTP